MTATVVSTELDRTRFFTDNAWVALAVWPSSRVSRRDGSFTEREIVLGALANRTFRWLWLAFSFSTMANWMQSLDAQWFLFGRPDGPHLVADLSVSERARPRRGS
jgi:hypothetical protein